MKRMAENAISYYTVKADDLKDVTSSPSQSGDLYEYTPSAEFLEVLHDFKSALRIDWYEVNEPISHLIGARFSVLYPIGRPVLTDEGDMGYAYSGGTMFKAVNPVFFEMDGKYYIKWKLTN